MRTKNAIVYITSILLVFAVCPAGVSDQFVKVKDVARFEGVRSNQLIGYGIIVGLDASGDSQQSQFTAQAVANMLQRYGITVPLARLKVKNVAAVMVTAELPPFVRPGSKIDITVSSLGDAKSLQGGMLLQTPLQAANGGVYAVAQGAVSVGGFTAGGDGNKVTKNHPTVGRIPDGAIIEQSVPTSLVSNGAMNILLNNPDFNTAVRVAKAVESRLGTGNATAVDAATVEVKCGDGVNPTNLIADLGELMVTQSMIAKVIVNERTGTVVIGGGVQMSPVAISHGNLSVEIATENQVSQPQPFSNSGDTVVVPQTTVTATEDRAHLVQLNTGSTLEDLVRALNELKVTPRDIVAILQALKQAGALHAELDVI